MWKKISGIIKAWMHFRPFLGTPWSLEGLGDKASSSVKTHVALGTFINTYTSWVLVLGQICGWYEAGMCLVLWLV
jgi:hypothetical protein